MLKLIYFNGGFWTTAQKTGAVDLEVNEPHFFHTFDVKPVSGDTLYLSPLVKRILRLAKAKTIFFRLPSYRQVREKNLNFLLFN